MTTPYNAQQIAEEIIQTALGNTYHGNALRVAKDFPFITDEDRACLDRWATGQQCGTDHIDLQQLANKIIAISCISTEFDTKTPAPTNPYLAALELVKIHHGTSGQTALAKGILSLYNGDFYAFSIGDVLGPLDSRYTAVVLAMVNEYARHGETAELRQAGEFCRRNFPGLVELSEAMSNGRAEVRHRWAEEREAENRRLYPEEYQ